MVKEHRNRSRSAEGDHGRKRHKGHKHHRRSHSSEREPSHRRRDHSGSRSPGPSRQPIKREPQDDTDRHSRDRSGHRHRQRQEERYDPHRRIKSEPRDERYEQSAERRRNNEQRLETRRQRGEDQMNFGGSEDSGSAEAAEPKAGPDFELSGKLTEDTNTYKGVVIKYNEPPEARKPSKRWRLYPFKQDEPLKPLHMHRQSAFLLGRDRIVADIPIDHPSCSKQHAVFQYRLVEYQKDDGRKGRRIAPYIIDLDSANGTFINNNKIEPQRYYELFEKDVIKFGFSSREYVLLHDKSNTAEVDDEEGLS